MNTDFLGFTPIRTGGETENMLYFSGSEQHLKHLLQFQLGMLINNRIPGLAPLQVKQRDLQVSFGYSIGGLITLEQYLSSRTLGLPELGELLERMVQPIVECKTYFLNEECFVIDPAYMFLHPLTLRTFLIYLPVSVSDTVETGYQKIVESIRRNLRVKEPICYENPGKKTDLAGFLDFVRLLSSEGFNHRIMVSSIDQVLELRPRSNLTGINPIIVVEDQ